MDEDEIACTPDGEPFNTNGEPIIPRDQMIDSMFDQLGTDHAIAFSMTDWAIFLVELEAALKNAAAGETYVIAMPGYVELHNLLYFK